MRTILVTGGLGFLGSHLVSRLLRDGDHVVIVDDLSTSELDPMPWLACHHGHDRVRPYFMTVKEFVDGGNCRSWMLDEVYHLASVVGPVGVLKHGGRIASSVIDDAYRVMDVATRSNARLCDVSTSEVYGGGRNGLCGEADPKIISSTISARLEYAAAKLAAEIAIINATRMTTLEAVIVRPFNVAGPRQSQAGGFVIPRFIKQALAGQPITVYGAGTAVRAFTHVTDVAIGLVQATRKGKNGNVYNIGNPANRVTINELAALVKRLCESSSSIVHVDPRELHGPLFEEASDKYPDASVATRELGWAPNYDLETIVRDAIAYIRAGRRD